MYNTPLANCKLASSYTSLSLDDPVKIRIHPGDTKPITMPQLFESVVKKFPDRPALMAQGPNGNWKKHTFQDYWDKSLLIARGFIKLGLEARTSCGILAITCPKWFFTQMAAVFVGGVSAGIYTSNSAETVHHILKTSNATICVVDDDEQMAKVRAVKHRLPKLKSVIQMHEPYGDFIDQEEGYYSWSKLEEIGSSEDLLELLVEKRLKDVVANECVALIYTSGTIGMPKAVMLSHDNLITESRAYINILPSVEYGHEVIVGYLPMNNIGGQLFDFYMCMMMGGCVYFSDRDALKGTLIKTIIQAKPTQLFGVPRIFEKIQKELLAAENQMSWLSKMVLCTARNVVENYHMAMMENGNRSVSYLKYWLGSMVMRRVKIQLGLDECKTFMTGSAPITSEFKRFFLGYDIKLSEVYGLSEASGPTHMARNVENLTSCGRAFPCVELKLLNMDDQRHGEICIRGRTVFMGYLNDPVRTKEALSTDGWLHTGDIGSTDYADRLYITGRLKELIVTLGGENIPPVHIEKLIMHELPCLSNVIVIGEKRKFLTMLVTIKTDIEQDRPTDNLSAESLEWMKSLELPYVTVAEILNAGPCPIVLQSIQEGIDRANANAISNVQRVQKFEILSHDFSIPTGELGPTLKLRRNIVHEKYADIIETFYK